MTEFFDPNEPEHRTDEDAVVEESGQYNPDEWVEGDGAQLTHPDRESEVEEFYNDNPDKK